MLVEGSSWHAGPRRCNRRFVYLCTPTRQGSGSARGRARTRELHISLLSAIPAFVQPRHRRAVIVAAPRIRIPLCRRHHLSLSAKGALSAPHPMTPRLRDPLQRSDPAGPRDDPEQPSPLRPSTVTANLSRMNFPTLYFWLFSTAPSCISRAEPIDDKNRGEKYSTRGGRGGGGCTHHHSAV